MRSLASIAFFLSFFACSLQARNLAQEIYDKEIEKLNPLSASHYQLEEDPNLKSTHEYSAGEEFEGNVLTQEPDVMVPSLEEYLTGLKEQGVYTDEDLFLINSNETTEGQKLKLNPEVIKKIKLPDEKKKNSWWDDVVEFFEDIFA